MAMALLFAVIALTACSDGGQRHCLRQQQQTTMMMVPQPNGTVLLLPLEQTVCAEWQS